MDINTEVMDMVMVVMMVMATDMLKKRRGMDMDTLMVVMTVMGTPMVVVTMVTAMLMVKMTDMVMDLTK